MSNQDSTAPVLASKPPKPHPQFPLFAHATRRWAKKINGKTHYFGPWDDPDGALKAYKNFLAGKPNKSRVQKLKASQSDKPGKPNPNFPLFPHANGKWAKKIRGQLHYFGSWDNPDVAIEEYNKLKDDLHAGRKPREESEGVTVKVLVNAYLTHKKSLERSGELSPRTYQNCKEACDLLIDRFGKQRMVTDLRQDDFADLRKRMAKKWGPVRVGDFIQRIRCVFKYGFDAELLQAPIRFGPGFKRPSKKTLRLARAERGLKMFEAAELREMVQGKGTGQERIEPTTNLKAMILLGVNCGYGNSDCATLPLSALDLDRGWIDYHRPKTGITRRNPLWPETVEALRAVLAERKQPSDPAHAELVFVTYKFGSYHKPEDRNPISAETRKLLDALGIDGYRNFYALRHTFETIGGEAKDQVAVDALMGHVRDDMASAYRERISDERLKAVSDYVRKWVFGEMPG